MVDWLERAQRHIPQAAERVTAEAAERDPTAVTAVPESAKPELSHDSIGSNGSASTAEKGLAAAVNQLGDGEEFAVRAWLAHIGETDPLTIDEVLEKCRDDQEARAYFLHRAEEVPRPSPDDDDRRTCDQCANLARTGLCLAARRGEIAASREYHPDACRLRRCEGYQPGPADPDRRHGREHWPGLVVSGGGHPND